MKCLLIAIVWLSSLSCARALVHFKKVEKGANGCKIDGVEVAVGEYKQDNNTCGAYTCMSAEGEAFIHYCQIPAAFAECAETAVITNMDFPQCCWACASWAACKEDPKEGGEGDGKKGGEKGDEKDGEKGGEKGDDEGGEKGGEKGDDEGGENKNGTEKAGNVTRTAAHTISEGHVREDKASLVLPETYNAAFPASDEPGGSRPNQIFTAGTKQPGGPRAPELAEKLKFGGRTPISNFGEEPKIAQPSEEVNIAGTKLYGAPKGPNEPQTKH